MEKSKESSTSINESFEVNVLTYSANHRKTYDTLCLLKSLGYKNVSVFAHPLTYKKKYQPLYSHRPSLEAYSTVINTRKVCENFCYEFIEVENYQKIKKFEDSIFLICGAGILPENFIKRYRCINSHPGYIPLVRGLDAYKWAIVEDKPIGVTTHFLGQEVDAGEIIDQRTLVIRDDDTFYSLAMRQYETEILMLVESLKLINHQHRYLPGGDNVIHRRMPKEVEVDLLKMFEKYKQKHIEALEK